MNGCREHVRKSQSANDLCDRRRKWLEPAVSNPSGRFGRKSQMVGIYSQKSGETAKVGERRFQSGIPVKSLAPLAGVIPSSRSLLRSVFRSMPSRSQALPRCP